MGAALCTPKTAFGVLPDEIEMASADHAGLKLDHPATISGRPVTLHLQEKLAFYDGPTLVETIPYQEIHHWSTTGSAVEIVLVTAKYRHPRLEASPGRVIVRFNRRKQAEEFVESSYELCARISERYWEEKHGPGATGPITGSNDRSGHR